MTEPDGLPHKQRALLQPPFCRETELADIISAIRSEGSRAVFLTSDSGLGASTILRELAAAARDHVPVLAIHGSKSLAKVPYGVMTPYLSGVGTGEASVRMSVLRAVLAELRRMQDALVADGPGPQPGPLPDGPGSLPDGQPGPVLYGPGQDLPIIIIDDAHSMDPASAELVVSLVRSGMVNLVASHASRHGLPEPLPRLWAAGMAENIVLRPLDQEQAHAFCEAMLGGPVLPATGWHFWSTSGGNPLFLRLLLMQAAEGGFLVENGGVWVGAPDAPIHGHDLDEAVRSQLRGLSKEGSEALSLIALSEPVDDSTIRDLVGPAAVRELLDWHLVRYGSSPSPSPSPSPQPSRLLALANPIYGEVIRDMVPVAQSRRLHERLIGQLEEDPVNKQALLRRVLWAVEIGVEIPDQRLLSAAILASRMFQSSTALELASQIRGGEFKLRAAMVKARAHYNLGDYHGALSLMEAGHQEAANLPELLFGSLLRAATRSALGMPVESLAADAATLRSRGAELARSHPEEAASIQALSESGALLVELLALSRQGRYSEMVDLTAHLTAAEGLSESAMRLNRTVALTMDSERLSAQGFPQRGMERAAEAFAIEHSEENDVFFLPETILLRLLAAAMCCGDWQGAAKMLEEFSLDAGPVVFSFGGGAHVVRGMAFLRGGKAAEALEVLLAGIDALRINDPQQLLGFCTAMAAYAAARLGNAELAQQLVQGHVEGTGMFVVVSHERAYLAGARYLLGHDAGAPVELLALADAARADHSTTLELNALAIALELGDESVVPRLGSMAAGVEGPWAQSLCQYAQAIESKNGKRLSVAAETLGAAGLFGYAGRALELSVALLGEGGTRDEVRSARSSLRKVAEELGVQAPGNVLPAKTADPARQPAAQLTRREREVSTLASAGRTDREIAEKLHISVRTVEGHLYRVYAKLGVGGREDLEPFQEG